MAAEFAKLQDPNTKHYKVEAVVFRHLRGTAMSSEVLVNMSWSRYATPPFGVCRALSENISAT